MMFCQERDEWFYCVAKIDVEDDLIFKKPEIIILLMLFYFL